MDTYKGESPAKKIVRAEYWARTVEYLGRDAFFSGKHLVLASREGGDISVLLGLGVYPANIIAVELDVEAAERVADKFPEVRIRQGDVYAIAREFRRDLCSAFLDFCSPLNEALAKKVAGVMVHGLKEDALIGCAFLAGREKPQVAELIVEKREFDLKAKRADIATVTPATVRREFEQRMERLTPFAADACRRAADNMSDEELYEYLLEGIDHSMTLSMTARVNTIAQTLNDAGIKKRVMTYAHAYWYYQSCTDTSRGVPMIVRLGRVCRAGARNFKKWIRDYNATVRGLLEPEIFCYGSEVTEAWMRATILSREQELPSMRDRTSLLYNIPPAQLAAWRAVETKRRLARSAAE